ncbi:hypothetical protein BASA81_015588 [Batrachochytrium salamandrivorans]|nr:hypothetical protein BASA81_015588 [Batrachochytrium salamandrivorans]
MLFGSVAEAIGRTPLVELTRFAKRVGAKGRLFAKLELLNPGYSKKDRIARQILTEAGRNGSLLPGQHVVELTSGNTGIGLAICCGSLGHPFTAVMSKGNSVERARMMRALGATVVLVDQDPQSVPGQVSQKDLQLVEATTHRLVNELGAFRADQFNLPGNENAHYLETASEVWDVLHPSAFVDFGGTGGTFSGMAKFFKEQDPSIHCAWVEPMEERHQIQGGGYFHLPNGDALTFYELAKKRGHVDSVIRVGDQESIAACRLLAQTEGLFGGYSTGANACAAVKLLAQHPGKSVVFLACDSGLKYLSLDLFEK